VVDAAPFGRGASPRFSASPPFPPSDRYAFRFPTDVSAERVRYTKAGNRMAARESRKKEKPMRVRPYHIVGLLVGLLVLGSVAFTVIDALNYQRVGFAGINVPGHMEARYQYLDDTIDSQITVNEGDTIVLDYELHSAEGRLVLDIIDPSGNRLMQMEGNEEGRAEIEAPFEGTYQMIVRGDETRGSYDLRWDVAPPQS
jgi:hypothetical protein